MTIERYFPMLEPPRGGLEGLRSRLDRPPPVAAALRPMAVMVMVSVVVLAGAWWQDRADERRQARAQLQALERTLAEHRIPNVAINDRLPRRMELGSDRVEFYLLEAEG